MKKLILILLSLVLLSPRGFGYVFLLSKEFQSSGVDLEIDPYYTSLSYYSGIFCSSTECLIEEEESDIYKTLLNRAFLPKSILFEASFYPLPSAGVAIRKNYPDTYKKTQSSPDTNWIEVICSGFEEPYAYSMFLGNVVTFTPRKVLNKDIRGKAYMGYLATIGDYHIKQSELIEDRWFEAEWKVKGDRFTNDRLMKWSYRLGTKQHGNAFIKDTVFFSIMRERVDFNPKKKSFFDNIRIEYTLDVDYEKTSFLRHYFMIGKSYPIKGKKFAFHTDFGFFLEKADKYSGPLKNPENKDIFYFMFRPNLKF